MIVLCKARLILHNLLVQELSLKVLLFSRAWHLLDGRLSLWHLLQSVELGLGHLLLHVLCLQRVLNLALHGWLH